MITWLASYPRSGNTLLRTILNSCFGLTSQSVYSDEEFCHPAVQALIGHEAVGPDPHEFIGKAKRINRSLYVKTHELPGNDSQQAIYVVRDGRSCLVSHYHFVKDILGREVTLGDIIRGAFGTSWSQHVKAWALSERPNTLVVRYEDLAAGRARTLRAISEFIGRPLLRNFDVSFKHLHTLYPSFFRCGSDQPNLRELDEHSKLLFERLHGDTLRKIGYGGLESAHCDTPDRRKSSTVNAAAADN